MRNQCIKKRGWQVTAATHHPLVAHPVGRVLRVVGLPDGAHAVATGTAVGHESTTDEGGSRRSPGRHDTITFFLSRSSDKNSLTYN